MNISDFSGAVWRKSSRSNQGNGGACVEVTYLPDAEWRKSSRSNSGNGGQCVEVAFRSGAVGLRDSKHRSGPVLAFTPTDWTAFLSGIRSDAFTHH